MSDTPRTDSLAEFSKATTWQVSYENMEALARELERENTKRREKLRNLVGTIEAHEIESLQCDGREEEHCNCLRQRVAEAKKLL